MKTLRKEQQDTVDAVNAILKNSDNVVHTRIIHDTLNTLTPFLRVAVLKDLAEQIFMETPLSTGQACSEACLSLEIEHHIEGIDIAPV